MARYNSENKTNEEKHTRDGRLPAVCSSFLACMTGLNFSHGCYSITLLFINLYSWAYLILFFDDSNPRFYLWSNPIFHHKQVPIFCRLLFLCVTGRSSQLSRRSCYQTANSIIQVLRIHNKCSSSRVTATKACGTMWVSNLQKGFVRMRDCKFHSLNIKSTRV